MLPERIQEFNRELIDEMINYRNLNMVSTSVAFKTVFLSYLTEAGETKTADCEIIDFKKTNEKMKLDGYVYCDYFNSLTLIVCEFDQHSHDEKLGKIDIEKTTKQVLRFYKNCKTDYFEHLEDSSDGFRAYKYIREYQKNIETVNIILITNKEAVLYIPPDVTVDRVVVKFDVWDIERLYQEVFRIGDSEKIAIRIKNKYSDKLPLLRVKNENTLYDCYIGFMSGELLAKIYKDEGQKLIEKNVRSFLQATGKINQGLRDTLKTEPQMFMAYNNGISTIAESIVIDDATSTDDFKLVTEIHGWQIVNGGQTTASIYNAYQNKIDLKDVNVKIKLTVIKDKEKTNEIISKISKYANSQNAIKMSDFSANDDYHIQMERLSRVVYIPVEKGKPFERWFYERARGQYLVEVNRQATVTLKKQFKEYNPKSRCISKAVAAKCAMSWMGFPDVVSKGLETNFVIFSEMVKKKDIPMPSEENYKEMIARVILFNECDRIIAVHRFGGFKAQQVYYTVALLGNYFAKKIDFEYIWNKQSISPELASVIEDIVYKIWNHFMKPTVVGVNIGQWCKKEECWDLLKQRYENNEL